MNEILGRPYFHNEVKSMELSGRTISNRIEIYSAFNAHFCKVSSLLVQNLHDDGDPLQLLDNVGTRDYFSFVEVPVDYVTGETPDIRLFRYSISGYPAG